MTFTLLPGTLPHQAIDWTRLGYALRASADDAHEGDTPSVNISYSFLLDNPEFFIDQAMLDSWNLGRDYGSRLLMADVEIGNVGWPADMPQEPNIELIAAYYDDDPGHLKSRRLRHEGLAVLVLCCCSGDDP